MLCFYRVHMDSWSRLYDVSDDVMNFDVKYNGKYLEN